MPRVSLVMSIGGLVAAAWLAGTGPLAAQAGPALAGKVTAGQEALEGVLVSAKKDGSTVTVTVVTGKDGRYSFPAGRLDPGQYSLNIRAVGYDLDGKSQIAVAADKSATADLALRKTDNLAAQLTNAEWLASMPGTDAQKGQLLNCVGCHTLSRPLNSKYSADDFLKMILPRMQSYVNQSIPMHPQLRHAERRMEEQGDQRVQVYRAAAEYLASINLSSRAKWNFELKTLPRPTGASTRVIYTEYDLPRETIEPHDVIVDNNGMVWYSNFGEQNLGKLDPKTGKITEFPIKEHKPDFPTGLLGLRSDQDGNLWFGNMYQATIAKFDRKTETFKYWPLQGEENFDAAQINMVSPQSSGVDGKVWAQNNGFAGIHRLDIATGKIETFEPFKGVPGPHNIYDVVPDSRNNVYFTDFRQRHIGRIDAKTGELDLYEIPTPASAPRRGSMDAQDRLWFGEYRGDRIGMFDTKTSLFKEWQIAPKWSSPYDVTTDRNGEAWTGSMLSDQVTRLNPATGEAVNYLLPRSTNIRRVFVDNSTPQVTFWAGNNHGASIVKVEPLE
ncbi:carboxypeptidase regulatory-like domain-containing protein [Bradyrhizobium sp. dw_411]|uniref:virginiamycin B lyase family protein n=1 Tax=Bradyrhizobium sp. dw_411 TaxID=2720082 RepID=UPI001BCBB3BD|nr:carboxypeptidase regulatory-like domain-containing protein [Bradyrhizobium sp. dw_411]